jgi:hypothetical protein
MRVHVPSYVQGETLSRLPVCSRMQCTYKLWHWLQQHPMTIGRWLEVGAYPYCTPHRLHLCLVPYSGAPVRCELALGALGVGTAAAAAIGLNHELAEAKGTISCDSPQSCAALFSRRRFVFSHLVVCTTKAFISIRAQWVQQEMRWQARVSSGEGCQNETSTLKRISAPTMCTCPPRRCRR